MQPVASLTVQVAKLVVRAPN